MTNFFIVPNEVFDLNLKPHEFSVLCYILKCCDKTKTCYPSIKTIANACSISVNTARKCVNNLCERNIISKSGGFAVGKFVSIRSRFYSSQLFVWYCSLGIFLLVFFYGYYQGANREGEWFRRCRGVVQNLQRGTALRAEGRCIICVVFNEVVTAKSDFVTA